MATCARVKGIKTRRLRRLVSSILGKLIYDSFACFAGRQIYLKIKELHGFIRRLSVKVFLIYLQPPFWEGVTQCAHPRGRYLELLCKTLKELFGFSPF